MGVDHFSLTLDNPTHTYSSGNAVSGNVQLKVSGTETTTEIVVGFSGCSTVSFGIDEEYTVNERHQIFCYSCRLFGDGNLRTRIPVGDHVLPFAFQLPHQHFPPNVRLTLHDFKIAKVRYGLQCLLKKPWYAADVKTKYLPVTIFAPTDLNLVPGAATPKQATIRKSFVRFCCLSGKPCYLQSCCPRYGFCPGVEVPFTVTVQNTSGQSIRTLAATLVQKWTLSDTGRKHFCTLLAPLQRIVHPGDIPSGENLEWGVSFVVPPTAPPTPFLDPGGTLQMEYCIIVKAASCSLFYPGKIMLEHPLIVGLVPLGHTEPPKNEHNCFCQSKSEQSTRCVVYKPSHAFLPPSSPN